MVAARAAAAAAGEEAAGVHVKMGATALDASVACRDAFKILRVMITHWLEDVTETGNPYADHLLMHFYRWLCSSRSQLYDPALHAMVHGMMSKVFHQVRRALVFTRPSPPCAARLAARCRPPTATRSARLPRASPPERCAEPTRSRSSALPVLHVAPARPPSPLPRIAACGVQASRGAHRARLVHEDHSRDEEDLARRRRGVLLVYS